MVESVYGIFVLNMHIHVEETKILIFLKNVISKKYLKKKTVLEKKIRRYISQKVV